MEIADSMKKTFKPRLAALAASVSLLSAPAAAQTVAFTFDDGPDLAPTPRLTPQQRNQAMLDALARNKVAAALFVRCGSGADKPEGYALAKAWGRAGTWSRTTR